MRRHQAARGRQSRQASSTLTHSVASISSAAICSLLRSTSCLTHALDPAGSRSKLCYKLAWSEARGDAGNGEVRGSDAWIPDAFEPQPQPAGTLPGRRLQLLALGVPHHIPLRIPSPSQGAQREEGGAPAVPTWAPRPPAPWLGGQRTFCPFCVCYTTLSPRVAPRYTWMQVKSKQSLWQRVRAPATQVSLCQSAENMLGRVK